MLMLTFADAAELVGRLLTVKSIIDPGSAQTSSTVMSVQEGAVKNHDLKRHPEPSTMDAAVVLSTKQHELGSV